MSSPRKSSRLTPSLESSRNPVMRPSLVRTQVPTSSPRVKRNLSKPFVDPLTVDDETTKIEVVTPVKNPSFSRVRGKSLIPNPERSSLVFDDFLSEEKKDVKKSFDLEDDLTEFAAEELETEASFSQDEQPTPVSKLPRSKSSPFTAVNFFQSSSPRTPKSERKRVHEDETQASRKKRETIVKEEVPQTPNDSMEFETPDQSYVATPFQRYVEPVAPYTAPARNLHSSFVDGTFASYSAGKPSRSSLRDPGAGRRISFMPKVEQLQVSQEFSRQLGSPTVKSEKKEPVEVESSEVSVIDVESSSEEEEDEEEERLEEEIQELQEEIKELAATVIPTQPWVPFFQALGLSMLFIFICAFARWYVIEKYTAGYCEAGFIHWKPYYSHVTPTIFAEYFDKEYVLDRVNQGLDYVRPECQPCPPHAVCHRGFKAECEPGFVKEVSVLAKYLPIAPVCKPDTQKQKRVSMLTQKALAILRDRNAQAECGSDINAAIEESELRDLLYGLKAASLSDGEFSDLWSQAIGDIENEEEVIVQQVRHVDEHSPEVEYAITRSDGTPIKRTVTTTTCLRSTSLASIPLTCAIRRSVLSRLTQHRFEIGILISTILGYLFIKQSVKTRAQRQARSKQLAGLAITRLKTQRTLALEDPKGRTLRCVPVPQLRDEIQAEVASLDTRKRVWGDVERLVETNSNVRARQTDIEGEIMRVWEWVGV